MSRRSAIFLDRDGTLIRDDSGYIGHPDLVEFLPGVFPVLRSLQAAGYLLVVVSNQSGIGRGLITQVQYESVKERTDALLSEEDVRLAATYYCPHAPWADCECRKPKPYWLLRAARDLDIDFSGSFMIGDKLSDVETGLAVGCRTILLRSRESPATLHSVTVQPDYVCDDWSCIGRIFDSLQ